MLWVFCPVYRDAESFRLLRPAVLEAVGSQPVRFVVVDDSGGLDAETAALAALPEVRVLPTPFNLGHQDAIVFGLRRFSPEIAESDLVVTMDSDGEDQPEDVPRLLAPLLAAPEQRGLIALARRTRRKESLGFRVL